MKRAAIVVTLALALAAQTGRATGFKLVWRTHPYENKVAFIADPRDADLAIGLDRRGFGGYPFSATGMVLRGSSVAIPFGPIQGIRGSAIQGDARGTVEDGLEIAIAELLHHRGRWHEVVVLGDVDAEVRERLGLAAVLTLRPSRASEEMT